MNYQTIKLFSSRNSDEWETPQKIFDNLNQEFNFNLDVAASHQNRKCAQYFTQYDNSLNKIWTHYDVINEQIIDGRVWCNPPYSKVKEFLEKATKEFNNYNCKCIVFLTFANTDTNWFHDYCYNKPNVELRFLKGRLKFKGKNKDGIEVKNSAMRPSMLIIFRRK